MSGTKRMLRGVLVLLVVCAATGCGDDGPRRVAVEGKVMREGSPLANGTVSFVPAKGTDGPAANADIVEGTYRFSSKDGPAKGRHEVVITPIGQSKESIMNNPKAAAKVAKAERGSSGPWRFTVDIPDQASFKHDFDLQ
jgi:hypothetical protein